ncbi:MAG: flagellar export chaperone FliS [Gammaproteobacteria bacterium]|nr:flagellar export chaperone FliS [Gammaproteobacteria bacterium]
MNYSSNLNGVLNEYKNIGTHSDATSATPHRLIQMLLEGALEKINLAKGYMQRGEIALKGSHVSWAISIIDGLRMSLDKEAGGEIATNLDALYNYMGRRLAEANLKNDTAMLDEVAGLLKEIKAGWDAIPQILAKEKQLVP